MANELEIYRGDDHSFTINVTDSAGSAIDITGYTFYFTLKRDETDDLADSEALISKTITTHSDPTNGVTTISLSDSDTNIPPAVYFYDFQMKDSSGNIYTIVRSTLTIKSDVTRRTT